MLPSLAFVALYCLSFCALIIGALHTTRRPSHLISGITVCELTVEHIEIGDIV